MKNRLLIKKMTGIAMLAVLVCIFALISNYITIGSVNITLSLIPIVIGAIVFGPLAGFILGLVNGVMVLLAPSTALFLSFNVWITIFVCLLKTGLAGLFAGFLFQWLKKKHLKLGVILASVSVPIINTLLFALSCMTLFLPLIESMTPDATSTYAFIFLSMIGINFIIELLINSILSPAILTIVHYVFKNQFSEKNI